MNRWFHRTITCLLISLLLLIFVGAIVRATGAGLGCPDWPKCWGSLIPPWKVEQVRLDRLDWEKFRRKAERLGRDPAEVTPETILESFNPVHTWTEFVNRLLSLPVGLFSLAAVGTSLALPRQSGRWQMRTVAVVSLVIVLANAWMGREIVYSGLKPGVITTHLALAMALIGILVYGRWLSSGRPAYSPTGFSRGFLTLGLVFLGLVIAEGIMGAQVREMTDQLAKSHAGEPRSAWIAEIGATPIYLVHRSFSWLILWAAIVAFRQSMKHGIADWRIRWLFGLVCALMVMGVVLGHVAIFPWLQVLHVGTAALVLTLIFDWLFRFLPRKGETPELLAPKGEEA